MSLGTEKERLFEKQKKMLMAAGLSIYQDAGLPIKVHDMVTSYHVVENNMLFQMSQKTDSLYLTNASSREKLQQSFKCINFISIYDKKNVITTDHIRLLVLKNLYQV